MAFNDERAIIALGIAGLAAIKFSKRRKIWQRKWLQRRLQLGCYENLMRELALEDSESYRRWLRMDVDAFEELIALISPFIQKRNTPMRDAIPVADRIALTSRYLTTDNKNYKII